MMRCGVVGYFSRRWFPFYNDNILEIFWLPSCPNLHLKVQVSNNLNLCNKPPDLKKASLLYVGPSSMLNPLSYEPLSIKLFVKTPG